MNRSLIFISCLFFVAFMSCNDDNNISPRIGNLELISGNRLNTVEGVIGDTLSVLLYNGTNERIKVIDFTLGDWSTEEPQLIYFDSIYGIGSTDTVEFTYPIPLETEETPKNSNFMRLNVRASFQKGGSGNLNIYILFKEKE